MTEDELREVLIEALIDWRWDVLLSPPREDQPEALLQISMTAPSCANFADRLLAQLRARARLDKIFLGDA